MPALESNPAFQTEMRLFTGQIEKIDQAGHTKKDSGKRIISKKDEALSAEAYRLHIDEDAVTLCAATGAGAYHGLQTLRQLLLSEYREGALNLPCALIEDSPRFQWRGFMLDTARYFYAVPFIKKLIDALSLHHINIFHWHLTDDQGWRLPIAAYPLLTEIGSKRQERRLSQQPYIGGFYTEDDIRSVVAFAAERHIEVVPEVDLPGHASAILASYPGLGCTGGPYRVQDSFGIFEDALCAGNDGLFTFAGAVFDTLVQLFPSLYIHIGGDEVRFNRWENCPKCRKRLAETGLAEMRELQSWITVKLAGMLAERGKTAIGWDEVLEDTARYPLPGEVAVMSWRGAEGGKKAAALGHKVVMSPNTEGCYFDYRHADEAEEPGQWGVSTVFQVYSMEIVSPEMTPAEAGLIMGGQCNLWSELIYAGRIAEYMIFPRIAAFAEALWSPRKDFSRFERKLAVHRQRLDALDILQYRGKLGNEKSGG
jgi:hexosaminidase